MSSPMKLVRNISIKCQRIVTELNIYRTTRAYKFVTNCVFVGKNFVGNYFENQ